jgi:hypothetical protein
MSDERKIIDLDRLSRFKDNMDQEVAGQTPAISGNKLTIGSSATPIAQDIVNVNDINGVPTTAYGSAAAARAAVDASSGLRIQGQIITYLLADGWYTDQYIGSATDSTSWGTASNWKTLGPVSVSQNTQTLEIGGEGVGALGGIYEDNPELVKVVIDNDGRILYGVKANGDFFWGKLPLQIASLLSEKVDKEIGKSLIEDNLHIIESNPEYVKLLTDSNNNILESMDLVGNKTISGGLDVVGSITSPTIDKINYRLSNRTLKDFENNVCSKYNHRIIVKANGTIGTDCDFTDIKSALDSINDSSADNTYQIIVKNGTYDISGLSGNIHALGLKNYVFIIGESKTGVVIKNYRSTYDWVGACFDASVYKATLEYAQISNMTLDVKGCKCCVHIDDADAGFKGGEVHLSDLIFIHRDESDVASVPSDYARGGVNCGIHNGQIISIDNCFGDVELWCHTSINYNGVQDDCIFKCTNNNVRAIFALDISAQNNNYLICKNNVCEYIGWGIHSSATDVYHNSWIPLFNANHINNIMLVGNEWYSKYPVCTEIHRYVRNAGNATINAGEPVCMNCINDYESFDATPLNVDINAIPYIQSRRLYGFAMENINVGDYGVIQVMGCINIGATSFNLYDLIALDSNGEFIVGNDTNNIGYVYNINDGDTWIKLTFKI